MSYKIVVIFSLLFFPVSFISSSAHAEDIEKINLRSAVELALNNNLNIQLRRQDVNAAEGAVLSAQGKFDVYIDAQAYGRSEERTPLFIGGATQEDSGLWNAEASKMFSTGTSLNLGWNNSSFNSDAFGLLLDPSYNSGLTLGVRQPLLRGFGMEVQTAQVQASQKQLQAASFQVSSEAANLAAEVKMAYWNLVFARQDIEVQQLSLELAQKLLQETETKISAGSLAEVEIYQPRAEVARREEQQISAERAVGAAEDQLKILLNSDQWLSSFVPTDQPATEAVSLDLPLIIDNALQNRPDIKAADLLIEAAGLEEKKAKDDVRPDLSLVGDIGLAGTSDAYGDSVDRNLRNPDNLWQVGVTFSMPLENRGARGNYQQARASHYRAQASAELLRQQIRKSVRTTVRDVHLALKALDATRKTSFASSKSLEAEQAKFAAGRSTTLDVLIAQQAYATALSQQNLTNATYANTLAELYRIQGLITFSSSR